MEKKKMNILKLTKKYLSNTETQLRYLEQRLFDAESELHNLKTDREWISVKNKLPETSKEFSESNHVLVWDEKFMTSATAWYNSENKSWVITHFAAPDTNIDVTHWMKLPDLPNSEQEAQECDATDAQSGNDSREQKALTSQLRKKQSRIDELEILLRIASSKQQIISHIP